MIDQYQHRLAVFLLVEQTNLPFSLQNLLCVYFSYRREDPLLPPLESFTISQPLLENEKDASKDLELSLAKLQISRGSDGGFPLQVSSKQPIFEKASEDYEPRTNTNNSLNTEFQDVEEHFPRQTFGGRSQLPSAVENQESHEGGKESSDHRNTNLDRDSAYEYDQGLLLSQEELTPINIDAFFLPDDQQGQLWQRQEDEFLAHVLLTSLRDQEEDFHHPDEFVDDYDNNFLLSGSLEEIEVDEIEPDSLDDWDYNNIFGDSDSDSVDVLASLESDFFNLALEQMPNSTPSDDPLEHRFDHHEHDDLPSYMYCQPCQSADDIRQTDPSQILTDRLLRSSSEGLNSIKEGEPLQDGALPRPPPNARSDYDCLPFTLESINQTTENPSVPLYTFQSFVVSRRPEAVRAALSFSNSFGSGIYQPPVEGERPNEAQCLGHRETIYGLQFSPCGFYMATASQDSTIRVWDVNKHRLLQTLTGHSKDAECLRVAWAPTAWGDTAMDRSGKYRFLLASGSADGVVKVWASMHAASQWDCLFTLDHSSLRSPQSSGIDGEKDPPQVYALQFITHWKGLADNELESSNFLMTSSDDFVHLWECTADVTLNEMMPTYRFRFIEVMSIRFTCLDDFGYGVLVTNLTSDGIRLENDYKTSSILRRGPEVESEQRIPFGGERNPHNIVFVFDAQYCQVNGLLGVALSDGSLRLVNGRGVCVAPITLPGNRSHLTSFCWDVTGTRLASCVASGHLMLWNIETYGQLVKPVCKAVLEGGHTPGRPLYGAAYCGAGETQDLVISWGVDGRLCLWDSTSEGNIHAPISTLVNRSNYSLYAVDVHTYLGCDDNDKGRFKRIARIGCGGGGFDEVGFIGVPVYLFEVTMAHKPSPYATA